MHNWPQYQLKLSPFLKLAKEILYHHKRILNKIDRIIVEKDKYSDYVVNDPSLTLYSFSETSKFLQKQRFSISKIIIPHNRKNKLKNTFIRYKFSLHFLWICWILEVLTEIVLFCLDDNLLLIQIDLNILQHSSRQLNFIRYFLAAIGGWIRAAQPQKHILSAYFLPIKSLEVGLFSGIMLDYGQIGYLLFSPDLMFGVDLRFLWLFLYLFLRLGLIFFPYLRFYLRIRPRNFFFLSFRCDRPRIKHTSFIWIFHEINIVLTNDEFLQCSD